MLFSGGGGFGKFHFGIIKALIEQDLMPRIIVGSSVGSVIAAGLASNNFSDFDIRDDLSYSKCFPMEMVEWQQDCQDYGGFLMKLS